MKHLLILSLLFLTVGVAAQSASRTAELEVVETKWNVAAPPRVSMLSMDPFEPMMETQQVLEDRKENRRQNELRQKVGRPPEQPPVRIKAPVVLPPPSGTSAVYTYQTKFKNTGSREVRSIEWEFAFVDVSSEQEVGRISLSSDTKIKSQETKTLVASSTFPPIATIDASVLGKDEHKRYEKRIEIKKVVYADGTIWEATTK